MTLAYRFLRRILRIALDLHYADIEVHGRAGIPARGPLLILANHFNGLVDPMLVIATCQRPIRFIGKSTLFEIPVLGFFLRRLGCIPAYRGQDPGYAKEKNQALYQAVGRALAEGGAVGIFPEGRSHTDPWLAEFRHGASRMALEAEASRGFALGLQVQLVGIHFERTRGWRGKVLLHFAAPMTIESFQASYAEDPRATVERLTRSLRDRLATMVLEAEDARILELAEVVERFGLLEERDGGTRGRFDRKKLLLDGYRRAKEARPREVETVLRLLRRYHQMLELLGVRDGHIAQDYRWDRVARFALGNALLLLIGLPIFVAGVLLNGVPYLSARISAAASHGEADVRVSVGLITAIFFFPLWYAALAWAGWCWLPWSAWVPVLAAAPALGISAAAWWERWRRLSRATWGSWLALTMPACRARLRAMRSEILRRIEVLIEAPSSPAT